MASTTFVDYVTPITATWLNEVDGVVWDIFGGVSTVADARTALGLGSMALQVASAVAITGGSVTGITDVALADGGTGASTAAQALINLGERTGSTGSLIAPSGTTAQRDGTPASGYLRFNSSYGRPEVYNGTGWAGMGGASGAGGDDIFYENGQTVTTDYTITTNKNAISAGPITINAGITVTVPAGSTWSVV